MLWAMFGYVTRQEFKRAIQALNERIDGMASQQAAIDAITAQLGQVSTDLESARTTLQTEIDNLAAANPGVDVTALQNAAAALDPAVQSLAGLTPTPAEPPA
jgi:ABC-type transporter Mla subunit MlaD